MGFAPRNATTDRMITLIDRSILPIAFMCSIWRLLFCTRHTEEPSTKLSFRQFSQINLLQNGRQKIRKTISTHKVFDHFRKDQNHDTFCLPKPNCVTCLFWTKRQVAQLALVKQIISWFCFCWGQVKKLMNRNCIAHLLTTVLKPLYLR